MIIKMNLSQYMRHLVNIYAKIVENITHHSSALYRICKRSLVQRSATRFPFPKSSGNMLAVQRLVKYNFTFVRN